MDRQRSQGKRSGVGTWFAILVVTSASSMCVVRVLDLAAQPSGTESSGQSQSQADLKREAEEARQAMDVFLRREKLTFRQSEGSLEPDAFYATDEGTNFVTVNNFRG